MGQDEQSIDVAREPVDLNDGAEFMDTGVLHDARACANDCGRRAARGLNVCLKCKEAAS